MPSGPEAPYSMEMDYGYRTPSVEDFIYSLPSLTVDEYDRGMYALVRGLPGLERVSDAAAYLIALTAHQDPVVDAQMYAARQAAWEAIEQTSWSQTNQHMVESVLKAVSAIVIINNVPFEKISIASPLSAFRMSGCQSRGVARTLGHERRAQQVAPMSAEQTNSRVQPSCSKAF